MSTDEWADLKKKGGGHKIMCGSNPIISYNGTTINTTTTTTITTRHTFSAYFFSSSVPTRRFISISSGSSDMRPCTSSSSSSSSSSYGYDDYYYYAISTYSNCFNAAEGQPLFPRYRLAPTTDTTTAAPTDTCS